MSKKRSQPPKQEPMSPEDDLLAAIDRSANSYRAFLVLLARKLNALPEEPKP